jgi:hypothetical protein
MITKVDFEFTNFWPIFLIKMNLSKFCTNFTERDLYKAEGY